MAHRGDFVSVTSNRRIRLIRAGCPPTEFMHGRGGCRDVCSVTGARKAETVEPVPSPDDPGGYFRVAYMTANGGRIHLDPLVEVIVGLLIVRDDLRPRWVKTYDDAREYAEAWAKRLRNHSGT